MCEFNLAAFSRKTFMHNQNMLASRTGILFMSCGYTRKISDHLDTTNNDWKLGPRTRSLTLPVVLELTNNTFKTLDHNNVIYTNISQNCERVN